MVIHFKVAIDRFNSKIIIIFVGSGGYHNKFIELIDIPLIPYEFYCAGNELSLLDCTKYTISCSNWYAGVTCQGN